MKKHLTFSLALFTIVCSTVTAQLPSYLPSDGLVGWWPFNGNANDESGNGNDGVVNGATLSVDRFGSSNNSYNFNGASNFIVVPNVLLEGGFQSFTWSFWFLKESASSNTEAAIHDRTTINSGYKYYMNFVDYLPGQGIQGCSSNPGSSSVSCAYSISNNQSNGQWNHCVFLLDATSGTASLYVNGILEVTSQFSPNSWTSELAPTYFGASPQASSDEQWFMGLLDDIAIFNRALTEQELQGLYNAPNETVDTGDGAAPLPQGIPYQAAARDAQGQVIADAPVNVRFSLHEGAVDGAVSYSETHALTTNGIGLFNTVFGNGTPEQSAFDSINWAATTKFLQVEIDLGEGYVDMGTTQLLSVPYAFRSDEAARIKNAGLPIFADNAAALAGGLVAGEMYRTASGDLKIVY
ncbi:MAG: LamG domain-containing protein [Flavobacteriales bacterium]|jgi:hypothetical protein